MMNSTENVLPYYPFKLSIEENFTPSYGPEFVRNYQNYAVIACLIYVPLIFGLKLYMKNRKRIELRGALVTWNFILAIFSLIVAIRTVPELIFTLRNFSFHNSICVPTFLTTDTICAFWNFLFVVSKLFDLGDTVFVVLRKRPLIFLHYYHHITVLIYTWKMYINVPATGRWYSSMNSTIHFIMYSYYGIMAGGIKLPKNFAMFITTLQLLQMIMGMAVNVFALYYKVVYGSDSCAVLSSNLFFTFTMYLSYFVLFARLFKTSYMAKAKKVSTTKKD